MAIPPFQKPSLQLVWPIEISLFYNFYLFRTVRLTSVWCCSPVWASFSSSACPSANKCGEWLSKQNEGIKVILPVLGCLASALFGLPLFLNVIDQIWNLKPWFAVMLSSLSFCVVCVAELANELLESTWSAKALEPAVTEAKAKLWPTHTFSPSLLTPHTNALPFWCLFTGFFHNSLYLANRSSSTSSSAPSSAPASSLSNASSYNLFFSFFFFLLLWCSGFLQLFFLSFSSRLSSPLSCRCRHDNICTKSVSCWGVN